MNTRRKVGREIGGATTGVIQVSLQASAIGIEILVNSAGLTNGEGRTILVEIAQVRTLQAQAIGVLLMWRSLSWYPTS